MEPATLLSVNPARKVGYAAAALAISFGVGLAMVPMPKPAERLACGHVKRFQNLVPKWVPIPRASHCCVSGRLVNDLKDVGLAQQIYQTEHGRFALTFNELDREPGSHLRISQQSRFQSDGTNWSVVVAKVDSLAGNYLLDTSGEIFFNETRVPTTNDLMLETRFTRP